MGKTGKERGARRFRGGFYSWVGSRRGDASLRLNGTTYVGRRQEVDGRWRGVRLASGLRHGVR
jgi:hypothetical protein